MAKKKVKFDGPVETVEQYLARGGKIEICPPCQRTEEGDITYTWKKPQRGRKKKEDLPNEVDEL